ncbi:hypothetical protein M0R89_19870 (plasmid) [Halorussus limi]|uniref:Uncharacterized protein n=1 Tax=Halorussus limi TaxID=2938695 RepID=A0A8U0I0I0_9EURY|nr:hypothetical protein [Halorussus limi]UPV76421.1 hypothetical protein M0R89_19870 [Halorussus limi]
MPAHDPDPKPDDAANSESGDAAPRPDEDAAGRPTGGRASGTDDAIDRLFGSLPTVRVSRLPDGER